jgi:tRNA nucleotidyltransferase/poly(A) polymerase
MKAGGTLPQASSDPTMHPAQQVLQSAPWLAEPELEACIVGSTALRIACERAGLPTAPRPGDLDLAWRLDVDAGRALLAQHGLEPHATTGALSRGTLSVRIGEEHIEITSFRGQGESFAERLQQDALGRESTIGALYVDLATDTVHDPLGGLEDWQEGRIRACGSAEERLREHPIRALRYLRKVTELGYQLDIRTRKAIRELAPELASEILPEAMSEELRKALLGCSSPGVFLQRMYDEKLLEPLLPELAVLFDGRPAGRVQHHPEISLNLHMILVLREAAAITTERGSSPDERLHLMMAALCHDLGKGLTPPSEWPSHPGHEQAGAAVVGKLWARLPGIGSKNMRRLCEIVAKLHLLLLHLRELRAGTLVRIWEDSLARVPSQLDLLASAVRCDRAGRLRISDLGLPTPPHAPSIEDPAESERRVHADLQELDELLRAVSGEESRRLHGDDSRALRSHLHEQRVAKLRESGFLRQRGLRPRKARPE